MYPGTGDVRRGIFNLHPGTLDVRRGIFDVQKGTEDVHSSTADVQRGTAEVHQGTFEAQLTSSDAFLTEVFVRRYQGRIKLAPSAVRASLRDKEGGFLTSNGLAPRFGWDYISTIRRAIPSRHARADPSRLL
jgi:hypothetical protein